MKKYLILIMATFLILPFSVDALCTDSQKTELRSIADELSIKGNHLGNNEFSFTVSNISPNIYIKDVYDNVYAYDANSQTPDVVTINPNNNSALALGGYSYKFNVYGQTDDCKDEYLTYKTLKLKAYNIYSTESVCTLDEYKNFNYCSEYLESNITENMFYKALKQYNENNTAKEEVVAENEDEDVNIIVSFVDKYFMVICITIAAITIVTIGIIIFRKRGSKE